MRAINCTQCGATIDKVSEGSVILHCNYCGARIMLQPRQADVKPPRQVDAPEFELNSQPAPFFRMATLVGGAIVLIPLFIGFVLLVSKPPQSTPAKAYSAPSTPYSYSTPSSWSVPDVPEKPIPVVNYQPRISWDGPSDLEHFESPTVDISSVKDLTSEEIKNTVFKNRIVKLRVIINTEGEIDTVETISGHPILVEAATASAKSSIFRSRSKPTTRILTYTFRVLKD